MLADAIVEQVEEKGGKPFMCGTPVVSDAETMVCVCMHPHTCAECSRCTV